MPSRSVVFLLLLLAGCARSPQGYIDRGNSFFDQAKYPEAALQYQQALRRDPANSEAYYRLGLTALRQDKTFDAYKALENAFRLAPKNDSIRVEFANLCLNLYLGDPRRPQFLYDSITRIAGELLAADPNSFPALRYKGYLAMSDSKPQEAVAFLKKADQARPGQPDIVTVLVQNLILTNQSAEALEIARGFIEKNKSYGPIYDVLYSHHMSQKRPDEAERVLLTKTANNPKQPLYVMQLAQHYRDSKKTAELNALMDKFLANRQDFPQAPLDAGNFYAEAREYDKAISLYQRGIQESPKDKSLYQNRIVAVLLSQGKTLEAARILDEVLTLNPADPDAFPARAALRMATGKADEMNRAVQEFKSLVDKNPDNVVYRFQLGRAYRATGNEQEARNQFIEALKRNPAHAGSLQELASSYITDVQPEEALRYAEQLLALNPSDPSARLVRTAAWALQGRYSEIRAELSRLTAEFPDLKEARLQMAMVYINEKRYSEAEKLLKNLYQPSQGDFRALRGLVALHLARNDPGKALAVVQEEYKRYPNNPQLRNLLLGAAVASGATGAAIEVAQKLALESPNSAELAIQLALLYHRNGDRERAIPEIRRAIQLSPKDPLAYSFLADLLAASGHVQEAIPLYRQSLQLGSQNPAVMNNLAFWLAESGGNLEEASKLALGALQAAPESLPIQDTVGWIYLKQKQIDSAIQTFRTLVSRAPSNPVYRMHLGMALREKGDRVGARREFEEALKNNPSPSDRVRIEKLLQM